MTRIQTPMPMTQFKLPQNSLPKILRKIHILKERRKQIFTKYHTASLSQQSWQIGKSQCILQVTSLSDRHACFWCCGAEEQCTRVGARAWFAKARGVLKYSSALGFDARLRFDCKHLRGCSSRRYYLTPRESSPLSSGFSSLSVSASSVDAISHYISAYWFLNNRGVSTVRREVVWVGGNIVWIFFGGVDR